MNTDLIGSIELTASAAILIAALSIGFGSNPLTRIRIAVGLGVWFIIVVILAATRALYYEHGLGAPGLGLAVALPIAILCITAARVQSLREAFHRVALWLLVSVHTVRLLGVSFVIFRGTQLGHHDDPAVALDSRLSGPALGRSSHRYFRSPDEAQSRLTSHF